MGRRLWGTAVVVAIGFAVGWSATTALAAPPTEPPGKSGEAPGHQKGEESNAADPAPPGHVEETRREPVAVEPAVATPAASTPAESVTESPRYENAAGKPKHNVPQAAEAAPETSVSAPGNSGRHKLTICHKGHAITVDVHAARAHVDGHGDTYAVAGAKGRAACPHSSAPDSPGASSSDPGTARTENSTAGPQVAPGPALAADPQVTPAGGRERAHGVSEAADERRSAVAPGIAGGSLPFTGAPLWTLALLGLGLVAAGLVLVAAGATREPAR